MIKKNELRILIISQRKGIRLEGIQMKNVRIIWIFSWNPFSLSQPSRKKGFVSAGKM